MLYKGFKQDVIATMGEFIGTTMFVFLGLGCVKTAQESVTVSQTETIVSLSNPTILFISVGMGLSLLVTAWVFYRITGGLFNPAVTLSLFLIGAVKPLRAAFLTVAQIAGGIAGSGLVALLTPKDGISSAITKLEPGMNKGQGLMLEAFLTAMLVFTVLMLAAEKHKATFMAPIGIGLTLFVCQLFGTLWTGCGMNPARSFGPSVISVQFPGYHWIYWAGPIIGSLISTCLYSLLKAFDYGSVVLGQDADSEAAAQMKEPAVASQGSGKIWHSSMGFTRSQRVAMLASGMHPVDLERAEASMVASSPSSEQEYSSRSSDTTAAGDGTGTNSSMPTKTEAGHIPQPSTMNAQLQARGGIGAPAAHKSGIGAVDRFRHAFKG